MVYEVAWFHQLYNCSVITNLFSLLLIFNAFIILFLFLTNDCRSHTLRLGAVHPTDCFTWRGFSTSVSPGCQLLSFIDFSTSSPCVILFPGVSFGSSFLLSRLAEMGLSFDPLFLKELTVVIEKPRVMVAGYIRESA